jgi:DNA-binding MarR family transcriptional regulator
VAGFELVESRSLEMLIGLQSCRDKLITWLINELGKQGFPNVTPSQISFLGTMDCGPNHAANIARNLNISRQAVHKIIGDLDACGWLETKGDPSLKNRKTIHFTAEGERMMAVTRMLFRDLDTMLERTIGPQVWDTINGLFEIDLDQPGQD